MADKLLSSKKVCELLGVTQMTLWRWTKAGKIKAIRTLGGMYRYPMSEIDRILGKQPTGNRVVIYGRVSSYDQKQHGDLDRQIEVLREYATKNNLQIVDIITDVASGLNTKRKGLIKLFRMVENKEIDKVLITYRDRLTRFGFEYLEAYFKSYGVEIVVLNTKDMTQQDEFMQDLIEIITSFRRESSWTTVSQEQKALDGDIDGNS
jgi:putative resolvase